MLTPTTKEKLLSLKLNAFIDVFEEIHQPNAKNLSLEEALAVMAERELLARENRRLKRLLKAAKLRYTHASVRNVDYQQQRQFNQEQYRQLTHGEWIKHARNILFTGPTGVGKSYLACALGHQACIQAYSVKYCRLIRLLEMLKMAHADGSFQRHIEQIAKVQLLIIDDWGIDQLDRQARRDLLEILEDRYEKSSTIITTQLPIEQWHDYIGDNTIADAICDRFLNNAYKISITGDSMRKIKNLTHVDHPVSLNNTAKCDE